MGFLLAGSKTKKGGEQYSLSRLAHVGSDSRLPKTGLPNFLANIPTQLPGPGYLLRRRGRITNADVWVASCFGQLNGYVVQIRLPHQITYFLPACAM